MRVTLLGGLLDALERNFNHGARNVRLFEIGKCFMDDLGRGRSRRSGWELSPRARATKTTGLRRMAEEASILRLERRRRISRRGHRLPALEFEPDVDCDFLHRGAGRRSCWATR